MARKTLISKIVEEPLQDGMIEFPQNNTLYADQFTDIAPDTDEDRKVFKAKNIKDVFEHYKPCKEKIILSTVDGKEVEETFYFREIKDFDIERIIDNCALLQSQKAVDDENNSDECTASRILNENLVRIKNAIHDLEVTYRGIETFFLNTRQENFEHLTLVNVNKKELSNLDSPDSLAIQNEVSSEYNCISLKNNYNLLVLPGYLGNKKAVHQWAQFSHKHCLLIITDYKDVHDAEMLITNLEDDNLFGTEPYLGHIVMTANYLSQRAESEIFKENSDVCICASGALAGRLANTEDWSIVQAAVGVRYGEIVGGYGTHIKLQNVEIDSIIAQGLIPINEQDGIVTALSGCTLYLGPVLAIHNYAFVRVFDWIGKVFEHYCNAHVGEKWAPELQDMVRQDIHNFLSDYMGHNGIIEKYTNLKIDQNPKTMDITISVEITFPGISQNFHLEMIGKGDVWGIPEWTQKILGL